jgi:hypothetical protein
MQIELGAEAMMAEQDPAAQSAEKPRVRKLSEPVEVPVFNCIVLVAPRNEQGQVLARAANLAGIAGSGASEREALQTVIAAFKEALKRAQSSGEPPAWLEPPETPQPGEQQRWIAVHL